MHVVIRMLGTCRSIPLKLAMEYIGQNARVDVHESTSSWPCSNWSIAISFSTITTPKALV